MRPLSQYDEVMLLVFFKDFTIRILLIDLFTTTAAILN